MNEEINPIEMQEVKTDISNILQRVFGMMMGGLLVTSITSFIVLSNLNLLLFIADTILLWLIAELIIVFYLSARITKVGAGTGIFAFMLYAIVNGITLSPIILMYTYASVGAVFLVTAGMFGGAALYGKFTKKDLTKAGSFFMMALIGLIIAGIVDIFIMNDMFSFIVSIVGIIVFVGLTAYDVQKIRGYAEIMATQDDENITKLVVMGALSLYLDFINIFLKLLSLMGKRRD
ncbi:MAG: Bax inhibitor-1/YccA family protein [Clostridia bacterium]|nr:Bax inhibitor-1/YccA family protein [Clostridia bacterium]